MQRHSLSKNERKHRDWEDVSPTCCWEGARRRDLEVGREPGAGSPCRWEGWK